jgi:poly-gamma-glutamate synthesis protein (capsule biosynthesis protein)
LPHWGAEYGLKSNKRQQDFAHALIDSGADLIVGSHPHVVQEIEPYNGKYIFYSLGNFIFDQYFSKNTQQGLALLLELSEASSTIALLPIDLQFSQPKMMETTSSVKFLESLSERSAPAIRGGILRARLDFDI